jgi:hypothetical protein
MASRDAQIERLKAELMLQDKMTKKVMDELRLRQEMLMVGGAVTSYRIQLTHSA